MKRMDLFCASPASTAICSSMEQRSMVRRGPRPYNRHNPHLHDRPKSLPHVPCSSHQLPFNPKPYYEKHKRPSSVKQSDYLRRKSSANTNDPKSEPVTALVPAESSKLKRLSSNHSPALKSSSSARSLDQVVVLRVSLHCKGCEGKVRKHISKMEGVTSFSIDLETKKVTVIGDVTPLGVLASVSKVKNAQLWPSPSSSSPSPSSQWSA
ncbi:hypothetical protein CMV_024461 [Castanea mollissima]|uniref:HMA domain-containing protein n=1 Tax=Castanea mollissima TaxID=60419 RepID=A0A8J4QGV8_9ROSI|nr:hypothetical protein CMV_024461 [Castanea mollissima]